MVTKRSLQHIFFAALLFLLAACSVATKKVTLIGIDMEWNLQTIEAKVNQPIEITVRNDGALDHNLVIEELGVDILLSPGDIEVVEFSVDHVTTMSYICSIPGHEEAGMIGEIVISD